MCTVLGITRDIPSLGITRDIPYPGEDVMLTVEDGELMLAGAWAIPGVLPRYDEGFKKPFNFLMGYNPQQVARQLGYDQAAARIIPDVLSAAGFVRYLQKNAK